MSLRQLIRLGYVLPGIPFFAAGLRRRAAACGSHGELVDLTTEYRFRALTVRPTQIRSEIVAFLDLVREEACGNVLEIGTARGGTLFLLSHVVPAGSRLVSLDLPATADGLGYPAWKRLLFRRFAPPATTVIPLQVDSHLPDVPTRVSQLLDNRPLDLLFIDGDHSYDGVRTDFDHFAPLLRSGGLAAFHDIVPGPQERVGGVPRFWRQARELGPSVELVEDWGQGGFGIGIVRPDGGRPIAQPATPPTVRASPAQR